MTDSPSPTNVSGLNASLDDAVAMSVLVSKNGMKKTLVNKKGEHFYSICGIHYHYDPGCDNCHRGAWATPIIR